MYDSLLCAHMGCYCMENLHYCTLECVHECVCECFHCSVTGCPPVRSLAAIKGGWKAFARSTSILKLWLAFGLHLVFLLSPSWSLCSVFQQKMLEENLRVTREVPATSFCNPASLDGSIPYIMFLHIPMRQVLYRWVESCCVTSLGLSISRCPRTDISGKET